MDGRGHEQVLRDDWAELYGIDADEIDASQLEGLTPKQLGCIGEELAASYLSGQGLTLLERSFRCPAGEADLVAFDEGTDEVVLVEVKSRRVHADDDDVYPEEAVNEAKQARYGDIAAWYTMKHSPVTAIRFDVVAVTILSGHLAGINHIESAFEWEMDR